MSKNHSLALAQYSTGPTPLLRPSSILIGMLALSIGWGVRGNWGASEGAMIPGALCSIAVSLFSGREDWRQRLPFFALFGALGWAFGGAIAYMSPLAYTQSGNLPSQLYGFLGCFLEAFLWAGLGGAGTAYAATETYERITELFRPLMWVMAAWTIQFFGEDKLVSLFAGADFSDFRQRNHFYWLDTCWLTVVLALVAVCAFDLWIRRFRKVSVLAVSCAIGAAMGAVIQYALTAAGWLAPILRVIIQKQGDLSAIDPKTGHPFDPNSLITNWPQIFTDWGPHMGLILGILAGAFVYFYLYAEWQCGSLMFVEMALGGLLVFILFPVLLSNAFGSIGGFRMMPPRSDDWAIILGAMLGLLHYLFKHQLKPVAFVAITSGMMGGFALMFAQFVKIVMLMPGNPVITQNPAVIESWRFWRSANWHSLIAEQFVGLLYGLAIVLPMAALAKRLPYRPIAVRVERWTEIFSVAFVLCVIVYLNLIHNLENWTAVRTGGFASVPETMRAPLFGFIHFSALGWFNLAALAYTICIVSLLTVQVRRGLAIMPSSWLGKGQLFFILFLWIVVIGNFERILVVFTEQRIATEGTIFINALLATFVMLVFAQQSQNVSIAATPLLPLWKRSLIAGVAAAILGTLVFTGITRAVYGDHSDGWGTYPNYRFGPDADWRRHPIQHNIEHN